MVGLYLQNLTLSSFLKLDVCNCSHWEGVECYGFTMVRGDYRCVLFSYKGKIYLIETNVEIRIPMSLE